MAEGGLQKTKIIVPHGKFRQVENGFKFKNVDILRFLFTFICVKRFRILASFYPNEVSLMKATSTTSGKTKESLSFCILSVKFVIFDDQLPRKESIRGIL